MKFISPMHQIDLKIGSTEGKLCFFSEEMLIVADACECKNGLHYMHNPYDAQAYFQYCGKDHQVANTAGIATVEQWYTDELLLRREMLELLMLSTI